MVLTLYIKMGYWKCHTESMNRKNLWTTNHPSLQFAASEFQVQYLSNRCQPPLFTYCTNVRRALLLYICIYRKVLTFVDRFTTIVYRRLRGAYEFCPLISMSDV
jgi:hypothetical protein